MNTVIFEGYTGIRVGDEQFIYDTLLLLVITLLALFAILFRSHFSLFMKSVNELFSAKEHHSLLNERTKSNPFFTGFLKFQALFLCGLFGFLVYGNYAGLQNLRLFSISGMVALFLGIICFFHLFKQGIYSLNGFVFGEKDSYKQWSAAYRDLSGLWGISLYVPVIWLTLDPKHLTATLFLFGLIYAVFRFTLIYMTVRIFYNKNTGILYLSSYLCAQEIVPLLLLYEGMKYLYNTIEVSTLWH
jgi:hypothetical protein